MSALTLRLLACVTMLIDHIGYMTNNLLFRMIGRIAFPIFAYLIFNGYRHTSNKWRYAVRLAVFAVLSQLPFSLLCTGRMDYAHGNVMITLLIGLLCVWCTDALQKQTWGKWLCWFPTVLICGVYFWGLISSDYGARGILLIMTFYFFDGKTPAKRILTVIGAGFSLFYSFILTMGVNVLKFLSGREFVMPRLEQWDLIQLYALLALILIFLYNGKKGKYPESPVLSKLIQYGFYAFYPAHMLILWLIY